VPKGYFEVTLATLGQRRKGDKRCGTGGAQRTFRLYFGATIEKPVNGMYSFFPSQPAEMSVNGFARPAISIPDVITDGLIMGKSLNRGIRAESVEKLWNIVRVQVESGGLWLGVHAQMPERRRSAP
jgi:hypothetical protein